MVIVRNFKVISGKLNVVNIGITVFYAQKMMRKLFNY
jgi:hypothetical protein